ncbi:MAG: hypothetical protein J7501_09695 [Bdellovibrio sp.]|nr:hypothetical protein [Bdellovibrio sp.]
MTSSKNWLKKTALGFIALCVGFTTLSAQAGSTSGQIMVTLTIVEQSELSAGPLSTSPQAYVGGKFVSALTDVPNGETVGIYLNGTQVAKTTSDNGVVNFNINAKDAKYMDISLRSKGKQVNVLHASYARTASSAPIQRFGPKTQVNVPVKRADGSTSMQSMNVQTIEVIY